MQARARSIDARLEVSGGPTGTQVTLDLPETRVKHRPHA
jgi:signal transduction histidine kinase